MTTHRTTRITITVKTHLPTPFKSGHIGLPTQTRNVGNR
jgi:hypothetical protein